MFNGFHFGVSNHYSFELLIIFFLFRDESDQAFIDSISVLWNNKTLNVANVGLFPYIIGENTVYAKRTQSVSAIGSPTNAGIWFLNNFRESNYKTIIGIVSLMSSLPSKVKTPFHCCLVILNKSEKIGNFYYILTILY